MRWRVDGDRHYWYIFRVYIWILTHLYGVGTWNIWLLLQCTSKHDNGNALLNCQSSSDITSSNILHAYE